MAREFYTADRVNLNEVRYGIIEAVQMWTSQPLALKEQVTRGAGMKAYKRDSTRLRWNKAAELGKGMMGEKTFDIVTPTYEVFDWQEGWTIEGLAMKSYMDVLQGTNEGLIAHDELVIGSIFDQLFSSTAGSWNADGDIPAPYLNNIFLGTHTHLLRQTAITIPNLLTARNHIREHGYNGVIVYLNSDEYTTFLQKLAAVGSSSEAKVNNQVSVTALQGTVQSIYGMTFVESDYVPSGYYVMVASGFGEGIVKPLRFHEIPGLEGIIYKDGNSGLHLLDGASMKHDFGFTTEHRGAFLVCKIAASGVYSEPSLNYLTDS